MRYGFVTCVRLGQACIQEILRLGGSLDVLVTLADDRAKEKSGRIYLDDIAKAHGIPLIKVGNINDPQALAALKWADLDWLFIIGWSQIAGKEVLQVARRATLGMHPTLLPEGRGRASIPWAIIKNLPRTGVTLFALDEGVDTGQIFGQHEITISATETSQTLYAKAVDGHLTLLRWILPQLEDGTAQGHPQDESLATVWPGRTPADGEIRLDRMTVAEVDRLVRATTRPYPGAFLRQDDGSILRVWAGSAVTGATDHVGTTVQAVDGDYAILEWEIDGFCEA